MIYIPKNVLKKLKLRKEEDVKKEEIEQKKLQEELQAIENTKRFKESMDIVDKVGKAIGEMREWAPYCSDAKLYNPFPIHILSCNKEQMLQMLIHAYGTAEYLKDKNDKCMDEILRLTLKEESNE